MVLLRGRDGKLLEIRADEARETRDKPVSSTGFDARPA